MVAKTPVPEVVKCLGLLLHSTSPKAKGSGYTDPSPRLTRSS